MAHAQHTPGPWSALDRGYKSHVTDDGMNWNAEIVGPGHAANARLIAAAPEMLAALEFAARFIADEVEQRGLAGSDMSDYQDEAAQALERVEAAITKAKGA